MAVPNSGESCIVKSSMKRRQIILLLLIVLAAGLVTVIYFSINHPPGAAKLKAFNTHWKNLKPPGGIVTALARDEAGNVWVGTEEHGVWRFNPSLAADAQWTQFTTTDGLGDDYAYSLAVDKQSRIWVGHLSHGVSVFDGTNWKNYDVPNGPIGERIFKIAVCPVDGDVWLGTSAGLTRYSASQDEWRHYTRANGLPANQVDAIAFDAKGNIFIGTQCDGIAMARRESGYRTWKLAPAADEKNPAFVGSGVPSKLINDLLVTKDGTVYAATDGGLAWSRDSGTTWNFRHGKDFADKVKGLAGGPPKDWPVTDAPNNLLPEDYVTCLAADSRGLVWLGFRERGLLALDGNTQSEILALPPKAAGKAEDLHAILPWPAFHPWLASYGGGLWRADGSSGSAAGLTGDVGKPAARPATVGGFPTPAAAPDLAELNALLQEAESVSAVRLTNGAVVALEDDWRTEGAWQGRYGRFWIVLCANWAPKSDLWGAGWDVMYDARMGLNHGSGDSMRSWIQWLATKDNRCLEMSPTYLHSRVLRKDTTWDVNRRESEWNDNGGAYPMTMDGPHMYCSLSIPAGLFYLSLYDMNKDGHEGNNRFRDYQVSIRPHPGRTSLDEHHGNTTVMRSFYDIVEFDQKQELAHARIQDFWGGVYKRFLVRGPTKLTVQINRNDSFNTMLSGVMLDLVDELPPPYYCTRQEWESKPAGDAEGNAVAFVAATNAAAAAQRLAAALAAMPPKNETWWAENKRLFYLPLLRWQLAATGETKSPALATSFYELNLFDDWEKRLQQQGIVSTRKIEQAQRWDGVTYSCAGMGNQMISAYVKAHPPVSSKQ